jgi:hypothetical protein
MKKEKSVNVINRGVNDERRGFVGSKQTCQQQPDLTVSPSAC